MKNEFKKTPNTGISYAVLHACDDKARQRMPVKNASNLDLEWKVLGVRIILSLCQQQKLI